MATKSRDNCIFFDKRDLRAMSRTAQVSAKFASQRAMRATVRAMRVMRVMRAIISSIFFLRLVWEVVDHFTNKHREHLEPDFRYKPPARHLESGDDPGNEYKRYNLTPMVLSLSLGEFPEKILISLWFPELLLVHQL